MLTFSTLNDKPLKLIDHFRYLSSNISSTKSNVNTYLGKTWTSINRLSTIWKFDLSDKIKQKFFQGVATFEKVSLEKARKELHKDAACCLE